MTRTASALKGEDLRLADPYYKRAFFYERAGKHKAKERMFKSFKWANFPGNDPFRYEDNNCSKYADYLFENDVTPHSKFLPEMCAYIRPTKKMRQHILMHNSTQPIQQFSHLLKF